MTETRLNSCYNPLSSSDEGYDENMPIARDSIASYPMVNGKFYAIGGLGANLIFLSDVWEYTPESLQSVVSAQGKLPNTWGNIKSK